MREARLFTEELPLSPSEDKAYRLVTKAMMRAKWQPMSNGELRTAITETTVEGIEPVSDSTALRYIKQMKEMGYLLQDEQGRYYTTGRMRRYVLTVFG